MTVLNRIHGINESNSINSSPLWPFVISLLAVIASLADISGLSTRIYGAKMYDIAFIYPGMRNSRLQSAVNRSISRYVSTDFQNMPLNGLNIPSKVGFSPRVIPMYIMVRPMAIGYIRNIGPTIVIMLALIISQYIR